MFFFFFSKPQISVIGEVFDRKALDNREYIHKKLRLVLEEINRQYEEELSARFMTTIDNEFQGLVCRGENLMQILLEISNRMHPVKVRFGIGIGEITTEIEGEMAISAQGPGYEKAREAIQYLRFSDNRKQTAESHVRVESVGENKLELVNAVLALMTTLEDSWSDRQREIIYHIMKYQEKQSDIAKRLGITQSTVQKSIAAARFYAYESALRTLDGIFAEIGDKEDVG